MRIANVEINKFKNFKKVLVRKNDGAMVWLTMSTCDKLIV